MISRSLNPSTPGLQLTVAIRRGHRESFDQLIARGIGPEAAERTGTPALAVAVLMNRAWAIDALLKAGADPLWKTPASAASKTKTPTAWSAALAKGRLDLLGRFASLPCSSLPGWLRVFWTASSPDEMRFALDAACLPARPLLFLNDLLLRCRHESASWPLECAWSVWRKQCCESSELAGSLVETVQALADHAVRACQPPHALSSDPEKDRIADRGFHASSVAGPCLAFFLEHAGMEWPDGPRARALLHAFLMVPGASPDVISLWVRRAGTPEAVGFLAERAVEASRPDVLLALWQAGREKGWNLDPDARTGYPSPAVGGGEHEADLPPQSLLERALDNFHYPDPDGPSLVATVNAVLNLGANAGLPDARGQNLLVRLAQTVRRGHGYLAASFLESVAQALVDHGAPWGTCVPHALRPLIPQWVERQEAAAVHASLSRSLGPAEEPSAFGRKMRL